MVHCLTDLQVVNTLRPEFFPENIRNSLDRRREMDANKKEKYIEITHDFYNLIVNSNIMPKSKVSFDCKSLDV